MTIWDAMQRGDALMPVEVNGEEYISVSEAAERVGVSRQTLWRWRQDDLIPQGNRYRRGRKTLFSPAEMELIEAYANRLEPISAESRDQLGLFEGVREGGT